MIPRLETLSEKKLVGMHMDMSFENNRTRELWEAFMPRRNEIKNNLNTDLYSLEIYDPGFFDAFNPAGVFQKWAAIEVIGFDQVPTNLELLVIPNGLYAVFVYRGIANDAPATYQYIFETWMPGAGYVPDDRPHFAVMGEKYKKDDPSSEEEIWIPVKSR